MTAPDQHLVGATVERELQRVFEGLAAGTLLLSDVTPALLGIYSLGHAHGVASREAVVQQLERDADRLWLAAFSPARRFELLRRRMDGADFDACSSSRDAVLAMLDAALGTVGQSAGGRK